MMRKKHLLEEKRALEEKIFSLEKEKKALEEELAFCKKPADEIRAMFEEKTLQFQEAHKKEIEALTTDHADTVTRLERELSFYKEETKALKSSQDEDKKKIKNLQSQVSKKKTEIEAHKKRIREIRGWDRLPIGDAGWIDGCQYTEELRESMKMNIEVLQKRWGRFHEYVTRHVPRPSPPASRSVRKEYLMTYPSSTHNKDDGDDGDDGLEGVVDDIKTLTKRIAEQSIAMSRRNKYDAKDLRRDAEQLREEVEAEKERLWEKFKEETEELEWFKEKMEGEVEEERTITKAHAELIARLIQLLSTFKPGIINAQVINERTFKIWRNLTPDHTPHLWDRVPESEIIILQEGTDLTTPDPEIIVKEGVRYETFNNKNQAIREDAAQKIRELLREDALKHKGEARATQQYTDAELTNLKKSGKTYRQISKMTGIKEGTVKARVSRFRNQQHEESEDAQA